MRAIDSVLILLFLAVVATTIVGLIVVIRNRWKAQSRLKGEEEERPKDGKESPQPAGGLAIAVEPSGEIEEEHQQIECGGPKEEGQARDNTYVGYRKPKELQGFEEKPRHRKKPQPEAQEEVHQRGKTEEKRPTPGERGGRPRATTAEPEKQTTQGFKPRHLKPEIVCWKKDRQWVVGVEVPEEFLNYPDLAVLQNETPTVQDKMRETCWQLEQAFGNITVRWGEDEDTRETEIAYGQEGYLLFKLSGRNQNEGRRVISPSLGWHLVITPEDWIRDEALSGSPSVAPELVALDGYRAHFFISEKGEHSKIAFFKPTGESVIVESKASKFELIGIRLNDAAQNVGPLFSQNPPKIQGSVRDVWKDVGTIVVGEEGGGRGRWRKAFSPVPGSREQDLPPEIAKRKCGWYFIRFYDTNDDLIESLDFRLVIDLRDIKIPQYSPFPSDEGHESVRIELLHEPNFTIQPADDIAKEVQIEKEDNRTILTIPPTPIYDETRWLVGSGSATLVQVTFLVERIWWAIDREETLPSKWVDNLLTFQRDDFSATSNRALWIRFPQRRWINRVQVGFEYQRARPYQVKVTEKEIAISLREFGDCKELSERDRDHFLTIWIEKGKESIKGSVGILPASMGSILCIGWGRKKRATAAAVLREGNGVIKVNGQEVDEYFVKSSFKARQFLQRLVELPRISLLLSQMEVFIEVRGSNPNTNQQVKASAHALAHALMKYDPNSIQLLERAGFGGVKVTEKFNIQT
jgi:ribosomal protein S9